MAKAKHREPGLKTRKVIPEKGIKYAASEGNVLTRIHLEAVEDGISLALVGAASSALQSGNRHVLTLKRADEGIIIALTGAGSAASF